MKRSPPPSGGCPQPTESIDGTVDDRGDKNVSLISETVRVTHVPGMGPTCAPHTAPSRQRYLIKEQLGQGGGGLVFAVEDTHLQREVALKMMHGSGSAEASALARFLGEARLTARLEHPNILPLYDLSCDDSDRWFFSMRKGTGRNLLELIKQAADGEPPALIARYWDRVGILIHVCDALAYAHSQGVLHRDVKPANVVLGEYGEVSLVDWGTALDVRAGRLEFGVVVGTPAYMSPEQARAEPVDERADVYCVGATMWHLLTLQRPTLPTKTDEEFWECRRRGALPEPPPGIPPTLLAIARRALAPDRAERFQSVTSLRDALREWQQHETSIDRCGKAEMALSAVGDGDGYEEYVRIAHDFRAALEDWPENARARQGLFGVTAAHARAAIRRTDLELAKSLLDPEAVEHRDVRSEVDDAIAKRDRIRRRARHARLAALAAALLTLVSSAWLVWDWRQSIGRWQRVGELPIAPESLELIKPAFRGRTSAPVIEGGALLLPPTEVFFLPSLAALGNVRLEVEMHWPGAVDGFEIVLRARDELDVFWHVPAGHSCQFGGFDGDATYISQNRTMESAAAPPDAVTVPFVSGRRYRLGFTLKEGEASLDVDGKEVLRVQGLLPLGDSTYRHVALRSWQKVAIHSIVLYRQALAAKSSPLVAGDSLAAAGHYADAARVYETIADDAPEAEFADLALARACLSAVKAGELLARQEELLAKLVTRYPRTSHRRQCEESAALYLWMQGKAAEALARAKGIQARHPDSRIAVMLAGSPGEGLPRREARELVSLLAGTPGLSRVHLRWHDVGDLSPLRGLPLRELVVYGANVSDLAPLRGMPLKRLDISYNRDLVDLAPLQELELNALSAAFTKISDLRALSGMPLKRLDIRGTRVSDLSPLRGAPLHSLDCRDTLVRDLGPLQGMPLEWVLLNGLGISDLAPLQGAPIKTLWASRNRVTDLRPLSSSTFELLDLSHNLIEDLEPLSGKSGDELRLEGNRITDLSPLASTRFREIRLTGNPVRDLSPLAQCGAERLGLGSLPPSRLLPLSKLTLTRLDLTNTTVLDAESLTQMPHLTELFGGLAGVTPDAAARLAQHFRDKECYGCEQSVRTQAALDSEDVHLLRELATKIGRVLILPIPRLVARDDAVRLATNLGGRLPTLIDAAVRDFIIENTPPLHHVWLAVGSGTPVWSDGSPVAPELILPEIRASAPDDAMWLGYREGGRLYVVAHGSAEAAHDRAIPFVVWER